MEVKREGRREREGKAKRGEREGKRGGLKMKLQYCKQKRAASGVIPEDERVD